MKVIVLSLVAHTDSVSASTANNICLLKIVYVEIHQVHGSNLVDIFCGWVPGLWMNCAEIVFAVAQPLGKLLVGEYGNIKYTKT